MFYLQMDVLHLADVFENFVESSTREYNLNPLNSYSLPGYTWKAGLKFTNIKLDYFKNTAKLASGKHLLLLLENNIRGGFSSVMKERSDQSTSSVESDEKIKLLYIGANMLYGWAMNQPLPTGKFEQHFFPDNYSQEQVVEDLSEIPNDNEFGFFIECDLEYPAEIEEKTENFPLCLYQTKADPNLFSD